MTSGIKLDGYDIIRFGFTFRHVTDLDSFDLFVNDTFLSFLISFYVFLFATRSMVSFLVKIELLDSRKSNASTKLLVRNKSDYCTYFTDFD